MPSATDIIAAGQAADHIAAMSSGNPRRPDDASCYQNGLYYKIGRHGYVMRWDGDEWVRSTLDPADIAAPTVLRRLIPAPAAHPRPVVVVERICHCGGANPDCGGDLALVYLRRHASQRGPVFDDGPYWLSAACRKRNRGRFRFATPPADPATPSAHVKCTRCRNCHVYADRKESKLSRDGIRHSQCPRCGCRTFTRL